VSRSRKIVVLLAWLLVAGCAKEQATSPSTPLVQQDAADPASAPLEEFRGSFAPGGIKASYRALFDDGHISSIEETRKTSNATGTYEFRGARLMKYRGAALDSAEQIELQFDVNGKLLKARVGANDASAANAEVITAIRDRAQALRSHAVAQHAVRGHDKN